MDEARISKVVVKKHMAAAKPLKYHHYNHQHTSINNIKNRCYDELEQYGRVQTAAPSSILGLFVVSVSEESRKAQADAPEHHNNIILIPSQYDTNVLLSYVFHTIFIISPTILTLQQSPAQHCLVWYVRYLPPSTRPMPPLCTEDLDRSAACSSHTTAASNQSSWEDTRR